MRILLTMLRDHPIQTTLIRRLIKRPAPVAIVELSLVDSNRVQVAVRNIEEGQIPSKTAERIVDGFHEELFRVAHVARDEFTGEVLRVLRCHDYVRVCQVVVTKVGLILVDQRPVLDYSFLVY